MTVLPAADDKARYVNRMFTEIAGRYDVMNRLMTFGLDQGWRRHAARAVARAEPANRALDVGTGTGDFLLTLSEALPGAQMVGLDFTFQMMVAGQPKIAPLGDAASFINGDALALPFRDASFDVLTTGFTVRNVTDIEAAFREMLRVVRPGGLVACLEVARPRSALVRFGHQLYFNRIVPLLGGLIGGNRTAYTYLPQSAANFPLPPQLAELMRRAGWEDVRYELLGLGAVAVHTGRRPA